MTSILPQPLQMQLSKKPKTFCKSFIAFLKSTLNSKHFEKKNVPDRLNISDIIDSEKRC